jgi:hypothetical protein
LKSGQQGISRYTDIWLLGPEGWRCVSAHLVGVR